MSTGDAPERRGPWWLPFLSSPVAIVGFVIAHYMGVLGPAPLWVLLAMVAATGVSSGAVELAARHVMRDNCLRTHLRIASAVVATTVIIYTTSWGPVIGIGYVLAVIDGLRTEGGRAWLAAARSGASSASRSGSSPLRSASRRRCSSPNYAHAVAAGDAACLVIVLYSLGTTTTRRRAGRARRSRASASTSGHWCSTRAT